MNHVISKLQYHKHYIEYIWFRLLSDESMVPCTLVVNLLEIHSEHKLYVAYHTLSSPLRYYGNILESSLTYSTVCSGPTSWQIQQCYFHSPAVKDESLWGFAAGSPATQNNCQSFQFSAALGPRISMLMLIRGCIMRVSRDWTYILTHTLTHSWASRRE